MHHVRRVLASLSATEAVPARELCAGLGIGRRGLAATMARLRDLGAPLEVVRGRGYRLSRPVQLQEPAAIRALLAPAAADRLDALEVLLDVDSTNRRLLETSASGVQACLAERQSAGRGRRGRGWVSPFAASLYLSLRWPSRRPAPALSGLSIAAGVAVAEALRAIRASNDAEALRAIRASNDAEALRAIRASNDREALRAIRASNDREALRAIRASNDREALGAIRAEEPAEPPVGLKWPNDLVAGGAKLGGLLVELATRPGRGSVAVVGAGVNGRLDADGAVIDQAWTDMATLLGAAPDRNRLAAAVLGALLEAMALFEVEGFAPFRARFARLDCLADREVQIMADRPWTGVARGIDDDGALRVEADGRCHRVLAGEVSVRPLAAEAAA